MHHTSLVISVIDTKNITIYAIVEGTGRNLDFFLRLADIISKSIDLVVRHRHKIIRDEECTDADYQAGCTERHKHSLQRNTGSLDGEKLVVLAESSQRHH